MLSHLRTTVILSEAQKKIALIESMNPGWVDRSRDWHDVEPADSKSIGQYGRVKNKCSHTWRSALDDKIIGEAIQCI